MNAGKLLRGPRLKVQWANRHIDMIRKLSSHLDGYLFDLAITEHDLTRAEIDSPACHFVITDNHRTLPADAKLHVTHLTYRPKQPIPEAFALLIGDAVHNLRAALDHMATEIIREVFPTAALAHFPFEEKRENLIANYNLAAIEKALPGAKGLILDEIKPYDTGDGDKLFWALNKLDNIDKHNLIIPTVTILEFIGVHAQAAGGGILDNAAVSFNAAQPQLIVQCEGTISVSKDIYATAAVAFGKGRFFQDEPVIPTLTQLSYLVTEALDGFERLIATTEPTSSS